MKKTQEDPKFTDLSEIPSNYQLVEELASTYYITRWYCIATWEDAKNSYRRIYANSCSKKKPGIINSESQNYYVQRVVKVLHLGGPLDGKLAAGSHNHRTQYYEPTNVPAPGYVLAKLRTNLSPLGGTKRAYVVALYNTQTLSSVLIAD